MIQTVAFKKLAVNGRVLAVSLFVLAVSTLVAGLLFPAAGAAWNHYQTVADLKDRLQNYAAVTSDFDGLQSRYEGLKGRQAGTGQFVAASSSDEAARLLEHNMREALTSAGARLERAERLIPTDHVLGERFGVKLAFSGPIKSVDKALERVGMAFPYYYFEDMVLEGRNASVDEVTGRVTVYSFRRTN